MVLVSLIKVVTLFMGSVGMHQVAANGWSLKNAAALYGYDFLQWHRILEDKNLTGVKKNKIPPNHPTKTASFNT